MVYRLLTFGHCLLAIDRRSVASLCDLPEQNRWFLAHLDLIGTNNVRTVGSCYVNWQPSASHGKISSSCEEQHMKNFALPNNVKFTLSTKIQ